MSAKSHLYNSCVKYGYVGSHSGGFEEFYLLGYNAVYSVERQPTIRRNISPSSSGLKNKPREKQLLPTACFMLVAKSQTFDNKIFNMSLWFV
jgi:hypothetical protein